ncbi:MAG: 4Fe-4S binding protein [Spirochaetes bacterium]|nr:4Fe-4S binding protein [Spirochaetota bacterium]
MKRKIIEIDQDLCNGCGLCANACPEGAIKMIDGKAHIVGEFLCDGLGACVGECPVNAIKIVEKEAEPYNEIKVIQNLIPKGENVLIAHLKHLYDHGQINWYNEALKYLKENGININQSFISSASIYNQSPCCVNFQNVNSFPKETKFQKDNNYNQQYENNNSNTSIISEISNWPIQLHLINPNAQIFNNADILIAADCTAFALGSFHKDLLKGKKLIIACPKLDANKEIYIEKLSFLFSNININSLTIAIMQVPCCRGLANLVNESLQKAQKNISYDLIIISIDGKILTKIKV